MTLEIAPFPLPPSANAEMLKDFGRYVRIACDPIVGPIFAATQRGERRSSRQTYARAIPEDTRPLVQGLYFRLGHLHIPSSHPFAQYGALLFRNVVVTPEEQYTLTKVCIRDSLDTRFQFLPGPPGVRPRIRIIWSW